MPKTKKKSEAQIARERSERNARNREARVEANRTTREDPNRRRQEQETDAEAHRLTRQNAERRQQEQQTNTEARRITRQDPDRRRQEQETDAEAHRLTRQNAERRQQEQQTNTEARRITRQDPDRRRQEQETDAEAHRFTRQNAEQRQQEQQTNTEARRITRQDPDRRRQEQETNAEAHRFTRQNAERRQQEQQTNTEARRITRQDPDRRRQEQESDAQAHRAIRQNPERRQQQQAANTIAHCIARINPTLRTPEKRKDVEYKTRLRKESRSTYDALLATYKNKIRQSPTSVCSCCGSLWYEDSTSPTSKLTLQNAGYTRDFIMAVLHVRQQQHFLCTTCRKSVIKKKVPRLALSNGFDFPQIPEILKALSPLEERLVAGRIPFMQIRAVGSEQQSLLRGNVVNVENDLDVCAQVLPRRFDETSTIQVQLMRRISYKSPYMYETIRPKKVYDAARFLIQSDLYHEEGITLSEDWSRCKDDEVMNFITDPMQQQDSLEDLGPENSDLQDSDAGGENTVASETSNSEGADETLIFRECDFSSCGIRIAPGEGKIPIPLYKDPNAEILSFPTIYGGNIREFKNGIKVSYTDIAKSELRRYDRRACRPAKLLHSFKRSFNEKLYQAMQICLRKNIGRVKASTVKAPGYIQNLVKMDDGYAVFKKIQTSPSFWKEKTKSVLAMLRTLGKFTFFITLSAAETKWTELLIMLSKIAKGIDITEDEAKELTFLTEVSEMIKNDPVTCIRHFDHRYRALLNLIIRQDAGIFSPFKVTDYFSRMEFQMRGSPHSHGLYWLEGAPEYIEGDESSIQSCVEFIDTFITSDRNEEGEMENLIGYQLHKHSQTCKKMLRAGEKCRFGFPKPPMETTLILLPLPKDFNDRQRSQAAELYTKIQNKLNEMGRSFKEVINHDEFLNSLEISHIEYITAVRSSIRRTTVFLKRATNACFINGYNRQLLEAWGANIDIQFALDSYACAKYCVGYILKSDGGVSKLLQAAARETRRGNTAIRDKLKKFANILINGSEISSQEAAAFLLGLPNTACSRQDIFINTAPPDERVGILKSLKELEELEEDCEDICAKGIIDRYIQRPNQLESMCLADFASHFEFKKRKGEPISSVGPGENLGQTSGTDIFLDHLVLSL